MQKHITKLLNLNIKKIKTEKIKVNVKILQVLSNKSSKKKKRKLPLML